MGDLERLRLVLEQLPDQELMRKLERERGKRRDDYPVRAVGNSLPAGVVFQHPSVASLRRELLRNAQLRWLCGLQEKVPPAAVYSRLLRKLLGQPLELERIFARLVQELGEVLPDFGRQLAIDGKAIRSHARPGKKDATTLPPARAGRRESDANWGAKTYARLGAEGTVTHRKVLWYSVKLHLMVDAAYELPVGFTVTRAAAAELPRAEKLLEQLADRQPWLLERAELLLGDRGYDGTGFLTRLWDEYQIKPVFDIRNSWQDGEATRRLTPPSLPSSGPPSQVAIFLSFSHAHSKDFQAYQQPEHA